ncbi:MAG: DEAD/DEAH box helicase [Cytophagales bacterium]|nr:DEAD/DEAH box helicase [Cytophagales bacterium]
MKEKYNTFEDFKLNRQILNALGDLNFQQPTGIQRKAIPLISAGHDVLGIAQTGTGKTAAFVLPILMKIKYAQGNDPRALILSPTRELAMQIGKHIEQFAKYLDIRHTVVYGGIGPKTQIEEIEKGVDIVVATPGRFMDIYLKGKLNTKMLNTMVLDEADKMMDMGFMPQIRRILEVIPTKRQNLLFSATFPPRVEELSHEFLEFPEKIEIAPQATTTETIDQYVCKVPNFRTKINLLEHLLKDTERFSRVIVFVNTRTHADNVSKFLERKAEGKIRVIHANKGQNARTNALEEFKNGDIRILVTTDVSSRGIDVSDVSHVINMDVPPILSDYVHRVGRTGRAKKSGEAFSFINEYEEIQFRKIEKLIQKNIEELKIPEEVTIAKTDFQEQQDIARAIDDYKKKLDPTYKGAFHEKKNPKKKKEEKLSKKAKQLYGAAVNSKSASDRRPKKGGAKGRGKKRR